jgi:hypothetical protein
MNAAETIQAAIEKLERQKADTTPGPWRVVNESLQGSRHDYDPMIDAGDYAASSERFVRPADAELIVTLHRTIDAQLVILRSGLAHAGYADQVIPVHARALAEAILGEDGQSVDATRLGVPAATASETGFDLELGEDGQ